MAQDNKNKKNESKKPRPNYYWIYGAIILLFFGLQIFGGHGYIKEFSVEQNLSYASIGMFYESTTGI